MAGMKQSKSDKEKRSIGDVKTKKAHKRAPDLRRIFKRPPHSSCNVRGAQDKVGVEVDWQRGAGLQVLLEPPRRDIAGVGVLFVPPRQRASDISKKTDF